MTPPGHGIENHSRFQRVDRQQNGQRDSRSGDEHQLVDSHRSQRRNPSPRLREQRSGGVQRANHQRVFRGVPQLRAEQGDAEVGPHAGGQGNDARRQAFGQARRDDHRRDGRRAHRDPRPAPPLRIDQRVRQMDPRRDAEELGNQG